MQGVDGAGVQGLGSMILTILPGGMPRSARMYTIEGKAFGGFGGFGGNGATTEDDIKILALNALMRQDPAKALPLLRDLLKSDKSVEIRRQALFVLSRSKDPQAQTILTEVATTSKGNPAKCSVKLSRFWR